LRSQGIGKAPPSSTSSALDRAGPEQVVHGSTAHSLLGTPKGSASEQTFIAWTSQCSLCSKSHGATIVVARLRPLLYQHTTTPEGCAACGWLRLWRWHNVQLVQGSSSLARRGRQHAVCRRVGGRCCCERGRQGTRSAVGWEAGAAVREGGRAHGLQAGRRWEMGDGGWS